MTTPFFVDALKSPPAQAEEDSLTLSRKFGREPPASPPKNLGQAATTQLSESTSGPQIGTPEGQVARGVSPMDDDPPAIWAA